MLPVERVRAQLTTPASAIETLTLSYLATLDSGGVQVMVDDRAPQTLSTRGSGVATIALELGPANVAHRVELLADGSAPIT